MKNKRAWIWLVGILVLAILFAIGTLLANKYIPDVGAQLRAKQPAILVQITQPVHGQEVVTGNSVGIYVSALGAEGLQKLEVFVDGKAQALIVASPLEESPVSALYNWIPGTDGKYTLTARATSLAGKVVISNPVTVTATRTVPPSAGTAESASEGTPPTVFGISTDSENFDMELDAAVEGLLAQGGSQSYTPPSPPTPGNDIQNDIQYNTISDPPQKASIIQKYELWLLTQTNFPNSLPPAPVLNGRVDGCEVHLVISDRSETEMGFRLYRAEPGGTSWNLAADLQANPGTGVFAYNDKSLVAGKYLYYIASYNAAGENPGNTISAEITDETCISRDRLVISLPKAVITPSEALDRLFCYASVNEKNWERLPRNSQEFVAPQNGTFDLGPHLRELASADTALKLSLECWGWQGETLVPLGRGGGSVVQGPLQFAANKYTFQGDAIAEPFNRPETSLKLESLAPPEYLHYPNSLADCDIHTGHDPGLEWACENLIDLWGKPQSGHLILVWHWYIYDNCNEQQNYCGYNIPREQVKGYHVYCEVPGHEPVLIRTTERNDISMAVLYPGEISAGTRYFVRAFLQDGYESNDSRYLDVIAPSYVTEIPASIYQQTGVKVYKPFNEVDGPFVSGPNWDEQIPEGPDGVLVGYFNQHAPHMDKVISLFFNEYISFDLSSIEGTITSARLLWDGEIHTSGSGNALHADRCLNRVGDMFMNPAGYQGIFLLSMDIEVTNYIKLIHEGVIPPGTQPAVPSYGYPLYYSPTATPPRGFWLLSGVQSLGWTEYLSEGCTTNIKNIRLKLEYVK